MRGRAGLEKREGREKSRAAAHLTPVASPVRRSLVGRENLQSILFAAAFVHETSECASIPSTLSRKWEKKKKEAIYYVGYKQEHDSLEFKTFSQCLHQ